jgi:hypothetical protein
MYKMTNKPPASLNEQILALSKLTGQMRNSFQTVHARLPPDTLEKLSSLESTLYQVSRQVIAVEDERSKLLALANTTQAVNSSLELDEVLQLVMDTIVHLTEAERSFGVVFQSLRWLGAKPSPPQTPAQAAVAHTFAVRGRTA